MTLSEQVQRVGFLVMDRCSEFGCPPSLVREAVMSAAEELDVVLTSAETDELVDQLVEALDK